MSRHPFEENKFEQIKLVPVRSPKPSSALERKSVRYPLMALNGFYTIYVSLLFAAFSYEIAKDKHNENAMLGGFCALCSFIMNAPMAWLFISKTDNLIERLIKSLRSLFQNEKKQWAFCLSGLFAIFLTAMTATALFEVAIESAHAASHDISSEIGFSFFTNSLVFLVMSTICLTVNTVTTRFVSSVDLLYKIYLKLLSAYHYFKPKYAPYYQLRDVIEQYGPEVNVSFSNNPHLPKTQALKTYEDRFYVIADQKNLFSRIRWKYILKKSLEVKLLLFILFVVIASMIPLWINLSEKGAKKVADYLARSPLFVLLSALSNQLFYINSGLKFPMRLMSAANCFYGIAQKLSRCRHNKVVAGTGTLFSLLLLGVIAYLSGGGYAHDAKEALDDGFGDIADKYWFKFFGRWTNLFRGAYEELASAAAGLIVNGGAFLEFCLTCSLLKSEQQEHVKASDALTEYIEAGEFKALQDARVTNATKVHNTSFWQRLVGSRKESVQAVSNVELVS